MCFGWRPRKTEPEIRPDEEEEMPDVFVTRPTIMTEMGPRETKIVTKVKSCESTEVAGVVSMVVISIRPHAELGLKNHREDAPHFDV